MTITNYNITVKNYHSSGDAYYIEDISYAVICPDFRVGIFLSYYSGSSLGSMFNDSMDKLGISSIIP
jgi:hypothetical protein